MTEPLTPLERRVYHYLIDFLAENTYQPSIREIAKKFRIKSTKTVSDLLASLSQKGLHRARPVALARRAHRSAFAGSGQHAAGPVLRPKSTRASRRCSPTIASASSRWTGASCPRTTSFFLR